MPNNNNNQQSKKKNKTRRPKADIRARKLSRNPGKRSSPDNMLSLTRDQFTATSPLNLFNVHAGSSPGGIRVTGRELVNAVTLPITTGVWAASTTFPGGTAGSSPVNPSVFPRLTAYTPIYEYFVFHKLDFLFQSNQPTTTAGEIILSVDYDPSDAAPASTSAQMRNISSTMANLYSDCSLQCLKSLSRLPRYETASSFALLQQEVQAALTVAVEGYTNASATTVGYIIAQYDVEFFTPQ